MFKIKISYNALGIVPTIPTTDHKCHKTATKTGKDGQNSEISKFQCEDHSMRGSLQEDC